MRRFSIVAEFWFLSPLLSSRVEDEWHLMIPIVIIYNLIGALDMLTFFLLLCWLLSRRRFIHNTQKLSSFPSHQPPSVVNDPSLYASSGKKDDPMAAAQIIQ